MAYIKTLKDNELIGGTDNTDVYPVSTSQAIFRQNPDGTIPSGIQHQRLEESLQDIESDAKELHRKTEKLVAHIDNNLDGQILEFTGTRNEMHLIGSATMESFGDELGSTVDPSDMESKRIKITLGDAILVDQPLNRLGYTMTYVPGTYIATFICTLNGVTKEASSVTYQNFRKYFGFAYSQPTTPTSLDADDFSNLVNCTITIPAKGTGFKYIYFSVPYNMNITSITQPDALDAPLAFTRLGDISRTIGVITTTYKLYRSSELIDSSLSKRLKIE